MSWFGNFNKEQGFFESLCYKVIKMGNMPKHVAVIMDGNRRFAKKENISRKDGHTAGFEKLAQVFLLRLLLWLLQPYYFATYTNKNKYNM